uniref:ATP-dependent RNA helicase n=1 Tax=Chromera velia CCMP2878 TaxID=1169474 RepID=A0A0G4GGD6_9ALVE|eukprot:Cvel_21776.t1-p1 / transcript=Cvel_21776.t1 / gene=Cvel_21776 / organism=Chromera_velia_CCMP2878 / gene_product=DEAD-box ATP-dependent RNA helicase 25, putative / transcript_product=DEAD-box ATP-dependent RNA helicase 25, putative / location=Cvel_scaffold2072:24227-30385(+) / protein_length=1254 / sequence_SO=supercontig / SO=protein_coding / is_pseudo=false
MSLSALSVTSASFRAALVSGMCLQRGVRGVSSECVPVARLPSKWPKDDQADHGRGKDRQWRPSPQTSIEGAHHSMTRKERGEGGVWFPLRPREGIILSPSFPSSRIETDSTVLDSVSLAQSEPSITAPPTSVSHFVPLSPSSSALESLLQEARLSLGVFRLTKTQERALRPLMGSRDLLIRAPAGSGKGLACLLPLLARVSVLSAEKELRDTPLEIAETWRGNPAGAEMETEGMGPDAFLVQQHQSSELSISSPVSSSSLVSTDRQRNHNSANTDNVSRLPGILATVLTPTREVALQVAEQASLVSPALSGIRPLVLTGGESLESDIGRLRSDAPNFLVATPGRLADHVGGTEGFCDALSTCRLFWIDDAGKQMSTHQAREALLYFRQHMAPDVQTFAVAPTVSELVHRLASRCLKTNFLFLDLTGEGGRMTKTVEEAVGPSSSSPPPSSSSPASNNSPPSPCQRATGISPHQFASSQGQNERTRLGIHSRESRENGEENTRVPCPESASEEKQGDANRERREGDKVPTQESLKAFIHSHPLFAPDALPEFPNPLPLDVSHKALLVKPHQLPLALYNICVEAGDALERGGKGIKTIVFFPSKRTLLFFYILFKHYLGVLPRNQIGALHAALAGEKRRGAFFKFQTAPCGVLFASDLVCHGMDFPGVSRVVQVGVPASSEEFILRAGKCAAVKNEETMKKENLVLLFEPFERKFLRDLRREQGIEPTVLRGEERRERMRPRPELRARLPPTKGIDVQIHASPATQALLDATAEDYPEFPTDRAVYSWTEKRLPYWKLERAKAEEVLKAFDMRNKQLSEAHEIQETGEESYQGTEIERGKMSSRTHDLWSGHAGMEEGATEEVRQTDQETGVFRRPEVKGPENSKSPKPISLSLSTLSSFPPDQRDILAALCVSSSSTETPLFAVRQLIEALSLKMKRTDLDRLRLPSITHEKAWYSNESAYASACLMYRSLLGSYVRVHRRLWFDRMELPEHMNGLMKALGLLDPPSMNRHTAIQLQLPDAPGLNIVKNGPNNDDLRACLPAFPGYRSRKRSATAGVSLETSEAAEREGREGEGEKRAGRKEEGSVLQDSLAGTRGVFCVRWKFRSGDEWGCQEEEEEVADEEDFDEDLTLNAETDVMRESTCMSSPERNEESRATAPSSSGLATSVQQQTTDDSSEEVPREIYRLHALQDDLMLCEEGKRPSEGFCGRGSKLKKRRAARSSAAYLSDVKGPDRNAAGKSTANKWNDHCQVFAEA